MSASEMKMIKQIETKRTLIRRFSEKDELAFTAFMQNRSVTDNLAFSDAHKSEEGARHLLQMTIESYQSDFPFLAFALEYKRSHEFIGACGMNTLSETNIEVFYALHPNFWAKGLATEVLATLVRHIFMQAGFTHIHAFVKPGNIASKSVLQKNNFNNWGLVKNENFADPVFCYVRERMENKSLPLI